MINLFEKKLNPESELPIDQVQNMRGQGFSDEEIRKNLMDQGYNNTQISEAFNQINMQEEIYQDEMQPSMMDQQEQESKSVPEIQPAYESPPQYEYTPPYEKNTAEIEEIAESIIDEKWQKMIEEFGDLTAWKDKVNTNIVSIKQEILRMESRIENIQKAIMIKIKDYDRGVTDLTSEIKALEKVLQKIIQPLTTNIKELSKITEELKKSA